ncbi:MAG: DUF6476 family protein [Pseudomonadota bacterium]
MADPTQDDDNLPEPANLRFLRILVTVLTGTMIVGILGIFVLLIMRLNATAPVPNLGVDLPADVAAQSTSVTQDHIFVVGTDGRLYVFTRDKVLTQTVVLD